MSRPRILLLGTSGQLGWELQRGLGAAGELEALGRSEIDVTRRDELQQALRAARADVIVNATAYTAVDRAESEPGLAQAVNAEAPAVMAEAARESGAALIHFSTDFVFDGRTDRPYLESDAANPLGVYGQSKLEGERAIQALGGAYVILRTSWVYSLRRKSFVTQVMAWSRSQQTVRVVSDQVGNPTWARALAEATVALIERAGPQPFASLEARAGLYHLAGAGVASRFEWAQAIVELDPRVDEQIMQDLEAAEERDFPMAARRPLFSALDCSLFEETFGLRLPPWREALHAAMREA
jgi:dTDP-4-dehydrorhamnose reductase